MDIKKLHSVQLDYLFRKLTINHGYLFGLSEKGFMTVLELKPPQKEELISVTTNISLPEGTLKIVGSSKNRRLIIASFKRSIVFIDTIEGPLFSFRLEQDIPIQSIFSDKETGRVITLGRDGHLVTVQLNEAII